MAPANIVSSLHAKEKAMILNRRLLPAEARQVLADLMTFDCQKIEKICREITGDTQDLLRMTFYYKDIRSKDRKKKLENRINAELLSIFKKVPQKGKFEEKYVEQFSKLQKYPKMQEVIAEFLLDNFVEKHTKDFIQILADFQLSQQLERIMFTFDRVTQRDFFSQVCEFLVQNNSLKDSS